MPEARVGSRLGTGLVVLLASIVPLIRVLWHWDAPMSGATCHAGVAPGCLPGHGLPEWWATVVLLVAGVVVWVRGALHVGRAGERAARPWLRAGAACALLAMVIALAVPALEQSLPAGWVMSP